MGGAVGSVIGLGVSAIGKGLSGSGGGGGGGSSQQSSQSNSYSYTRPYEYVPSKEAYDKAIPIFQDATSKALGTLQSYNAATTDLAEPYIMTSYRAMDSLLDSLGISRPQMGTYEDLQAQKAYQAQYANSQAPKYADLTEEQKTKYATELADYNTKKAAFNDAKTQAERNKAVESILLHPWNGSSEVSQDMARELYNLKNKNWEDAMASGIGDGIESRWYNLDYLDANKEDTDEWRQKRLIAEMKIKDSVNDQSLATPDPFHFGRHGYSPQGSSVARYNGVSGDDLYNYLNSIRKRNFGLTNEGTPVDPGAAPVLPQGAVLPAGPNPDPYKQIMTDPYEASMRIQQIIQADPSYQFRLAEGQRALGAQASARGQVGSTRLAKELVSYGSGLAASSLSEWRDRMAQLVMSGQQGLATSAPGNTNTGTVGAQLQTQLGDKVAGATLDKSRDFVVGPKISESTSSSSSQGTSTTAPMNPSGGGTLGAIATGASTFLGGLGNLF